jgi:DNA polymerase III alpha subunit
MRLDKFSQTILQDQDIFDIIYEKDSDLLADSIADISPDVTRLIEHALISIKLADQVSYDRSLEEYDHSHQIDWFMPDEYKIMDIEEFLVNQCPQQHYPRLIDELNAYKARNMLDLLRWLKYFVDTCRTNNIVWGVGRGSSVASYILYLIGVHKIDSIKYNLDWQEFLR